MCYCERLHVVPVLPNQRPVFNKGLSPGRVRTVTSQAACGPVWREASQPPASSGLDAPLMFSLSLHRIPKGLSSKVLADDKPKQDEKQAHIKGRSTHIPPTPTTC